jgi:hypothetical protein
MEGDRKDLLPQFSSCSVFCISCKNVCDLAFACASTAVADWVKMAFFVYATISAAISVSHICDSAACVFSAPTSVQIHCEPHENPCSCAGCFSGFGLNKAPHVLAVKTASDPEE